MNVIDLFAGPGGWDLAALELGIDVLGVELDDAACATRAAAGLRTLQADVADLDPRQVMRNHFPLGEMPLDGLIASPPCQAFSMAGNGVGRDALDVYVQQCARMARPDVRRPWTREQLDARCHDSRAHLVLEPLRWALALRPAWIALEQVPPVLPVWEAVADALKGHGYATWTGILSAERFGVPQTRKRAVLLASRSVAVHPPTATHARYVAPRRRDEQTLELFEAPEPERITLPEDRHLQPWVSMAEALGWGMSVRPSVVVASGGEKRWGAKPLGGGTGSQRTIDTAKADGDWLPQDRVGFARRADDRGAAADVAEEAIDGYRKRDLRDASEPAFALTEKARSAVRLRANRQERSAVRDVDEPAPTITGGHDTADRVWELRAGTGDHDEAQRALDEPAPTMRFGARLNTVAWRVERPATTIQGDPRVFAPGGHIANDGRDNSQMIGRSEEAVRVSIEEAAVLQSFPAAHPWQGTRSKIFEQIGNAIPPLMALAILRELAGTVDPDPAVTPGQTTIEEYLR